jgi:hypothetical protein
MNTARDAAYVPPVRVVIEFSGAGRWSGTVQAESATVVDVPFEGRLELLRLLETLIDRRPDDPKDR